MFGPIFSAVAIGSRDRWIFWQTGNGLGDKLVMLTGMERQADTVLTAKFPRSHAAAVHIDIGADQCAQLVPCHP